MTLIDKLIQMQGSQLKEIPQSDSSVVVLADTKSFSVAKQNKAVFNILNPKKVVFMGSSNDQDPTTRAERREEELERRRRRSPLSSRGGVVGGGAIAAMAGRKGDPYEDELNNLINQSGSLGEKLIEVGGAVAALRILLKGFGLVLPKLPGGATAAKGGSKIAGLFRGLLKGGQGIFKGLVETIKLLTKERSFAAGGRSVVGAARAGAGGLARVAGNIFQGGKNIVTGGANFVKNIPNLITTGFSKVKFDGKTLARFLMTKGGKSLLLGLRGSRILGTFGLSLIADHFAGKSREVADEIRAAMDARAAVHRTSGMTESQYKKLQFQKENKGKSASSYHGEKAVQFSSQHPAMREAYNAANPNNQLSEAEYIQQLDAGEKYEFPAGNRISTFKSTTFAGLAGEHLKAMSGASGVINPDRKGGLTGVLREQLTMPTGEPLVARATPNMLGVSEQFMGTENDIIPGQLPFFRGKGEISSDRMRFDAFEDTMRSISSRNTQPIIVNVNNGSNANESKTLFTDTSTRADDNPDLDAITNGGTALKNRLNQSWIDQ